MTLSTADQVGQMLLGGFEGLTAPNYLLDWLREGRLGGIILFARNIEHPRQVAALTESLHAAAKHPLLIAIDQEGGTVARLREGFCESPGALALASIAQDNKASVEAVSGVLAAEMRALGINWTYAPELDITYNTENPTVGTRSFGRDPESVAVLGSAAIRGFQANGVAAAAKHFPGLGNTHVDTHLALPRLDTPLAQPRTVDLIPYRAALKNDLATLMTTHTIYTALDSAHPATLSAVIIQEMIRDELGFEGVVTTDCMEMKAIDDHYGVQDSVVRAAKAGIDMILFSHTPAKQAAAYDHLWQAVEQGEVPLEIIHRANARIAALKARFPASAPDISRIKSEAHQVIMQRAAEKSIILLRAEEGVLPLQDDDDLALVEFSPAVDSIVQEATDTSTLGYYLRHALPHVKIHQLPPTPQALPNITARTLIIATRNAHLIPAQAEAVTQFMEGGQRIILTALRNPHDAQLIDGGTVLCTSGDSRPSLQALCAALLGAFQPEGRPVL
ncbi:MAG: beta-N-acetylhexosaminidase [Anaerolineales bacterium]